jgi:hypothetical protein
MTKLLSTLVVVAVGLPDQGPGHGEGGTAVDVYGIVVANGYASGDQPLQGGNVQIHNG